MKQYLRLNLLVLVIAIGFGLACWLILPRPGINPRNALRLQPGMTEEEVEQILGAPGHLKEEILEGRVYCKLWEQGDIQVKIDFASADRRMLGGTFTRRFRGGEDGVGLGPRPYGYERTFLESLRIELGLSAH